MSSSLKEEYLVYKKLTEFNQQSNETKSKNHSSAADIQVKIQLRKGS